MVKGNEIGYQPNAGRFISLSDHALPHSTTSTCIGMYTRICPIAIYQPSA